MTSELNETCLEILGKTGMYQGYVVEEIVKRVLPHMLTDIKVAFLLEFIYDEAIKEGGEQVKKEIIEGLR